MGTDLDGNSTFLPSSRSGHPHAQSLKSSYLFTAETRCWNQLRSKISNESIGFDRSWYTHLPVFDGKLPQDLKLQEVTSEETEKVIALVVEPPLTIFIAVYLKGRSMARILALRLTRQEKEELHLRGLQLQLHCMKMLLKLSRRLCFLLRLLVPSRQPVSTENTVKDGEGEDSLL